MTVIGCLQSIDPKVPNARCALPEGHLGPHGPAFSAALEPHAFKFGQADDYKLGCALCHCLPTDPIHRPTLAQPPDPEADETTLRDEQAPVFDPIERYLTILNPKQETPFTEGDPVQMAIATALLLGTLELRKIADTLDSLDTHVMEERQQRDRERAK